VLLALVFAVTGCEVGDHHKHMELSDLAHDDCASPFPAQDPNILEACCGEFGGGAHCVPPGLVPEDVRDLVDTCDNGGLCIPDKFIESGGALEVKVCDSINGSGRCMSICVPQVQEFINLLQADVCDPGELCVPCVNPLDGEATGACELTDACGNPDSGPKDPLPCPYEGPPLIDPLQYPPCPASMCTTGKAHCLPNEMVPGDMADQLGVCDAESKCVPDEFIASLGNYQPAFCESLGNAEGRCMSPCLPEVALQADRLTQSTCPSTHICVPCTDPLSGEDTGACTTPCDEPEEDPYVFPPCCDNRGTCVPRQSILDMGEDPSQLGRDTCPENPDLLCSPNEMIDGDYKAQPCTTGWFFQWLMGSQYGPGACMPECIPAVDNFMLGQENCSDGMKCAPCLDPLAGGAPSGACDYL
jgi:hypothetical protein